MSKSLTATVKHDVEDILDEVAKVLRQAADGLSDNAEDAVAKATKALHQAAQALVDKAPPEAKDLAKKVMNETKAHPIATTAAVLSAAAALITLLTLGQKTSV
jgi:ElaB/YqjD/DUF883 family membrane-anchored ribosome-binding protein